MLKVQRSPLLYSLSCKSKFTCSLGTVGHDMRRIDFIDSGLHSTIYQYTGMAMLVVVLLHGSGTIADLVRIPTAFMVCMPILMIQIRRTLSLLEVFSPAY